MIKAYPCGLMVKTKQGNVNGMITCVSIRFKSVQYEISAMVGGGQNIFWMNEAEFTTNINKKQIGFKNASAQR